MSEIEMNSLKGEMQIAPLVLFVYNRADHVRQCLKAINCNELAEKTVFYIFSDGPKDITDAKKVAEVRGILKEFSHNNSFKEVVIIESEPNKGLASSVISGVSTVITKNGRVIVLEDDLITAKDYIRFMNEALDFYKNDSNIWSIAGYTPALKCLRSYKEDVWFCDRAGSWGWATWLDRWNSVDWDVADYEDFRCNPSRVRLFKQRGFNMPELLDKQMQGKIDSWAIRFCYEQFKQNKYTVNPTCSRVINSGFDGSGTHKEVHEKWKVSFPNDVHEIRFIPYRTNKRISRQYYYYFAQYPHIRFARIVWKKMKEILGIKKSLNIFD